MNHWANAGTILGLICDRLQNCTLSLHPTDHHNIAIAAETGTRDNRWTYRREYTLDQLELADPYVHADHFVRYFQQHCKHKVTK